MYIRLLTGFVSLALCMPSCCHADDLALWDRLKREAPDHWKSLESMTSSAAGSQTWTSSCDVHDPNRGNARDLFEKQVRQFWIRDGFGKVIADRYDISGKWKGRTVFCFNPDYGFSAKQTASGGPYFLTVFALRAEPGFQKLHDHWGMALRALQASCMSPVSTEALAQVLQDKGFHFFGCREAARDGKVLVELDYGVDPIGAAAQWDPSMRRSKVLLDPNNSWRVVGSTMTQDRQEGDQELEYARDAPNAAVVAKVTEHYVDLPQRGVASTDVFENTFVSFDPPPSSEFYLPSIGLPDVTVENHRISPSGRLWLVGLAFVAFGAALYVLVQWLKPSRPR